MTYTDPNAVKLYNLQEEIDKLKEEIRRLKISNIELHELLQKLLNEKESPSQT